MNEADMQAIRTKVAFAMGDLTTAFDILQDIRDILDKYPVVTE